MAKCIKSVHVELILPAHFLTIKSSLPSIVVDVQVYFILVRQVLREKQQHQVVTVEIAAFNDVP